MTATNQIRASAQLLVEGRDEVNFFESMLDQLGYSGLDIHDYGGVSQLRTFLAQFVKAPGFDSVTRLGVIRDADASPSSAMQSVQSSFQNARLTVPDHAGEFVGTNPAVGVLILPDAESPGMLETCLIRTFEGSEVDACIDEFLACASRTSDVPISRPEKARAHAWLATKPEPHVSVGVAAKRGYWDLAHPQLESIRSFLESLTAS